jgi:hypothetical protein
MAENWRWRQRRRQPLEPWIDEYCLMRLEVLVPLIIHIAMKHGCDDDWPELCYPPMQ